MFSLNNFPLKFQPNDLAPYMSANTINCHYGKHLFTYIKNLNDLIADTDYKNLTLIEIIKRSAVDNSAKKIFNNAAQVFNHNFFFAGIGIGNNSKCPSQIIEQFGSTENFIAQFRASALSLFGSGWTWLVFDGTELKIINTQNAETPISMGLIPILTLDVWEHAYYLDYQNRRGDFIDVFFNNLINWDVVLEKLVSL